LTVLATNLARRGVKQEFDEFPTDQIGERREDVIVLVFHGIGQLKLATFFAPKSRRRDHGARSPAPSQATDPVSHGRSAIGNGPSLRIPFRRRLNDSKLRQIRTILGSPPGSPPTESVAPEMPCFIGFFASHLSVAERETATLIDL
jgi:hypothetical protein